MKFWKSIKLFILGNSTEVVEELIFPIFERFQKFIRESIGIYSCYNCNCLVDRGTPIIFNVVDKPEFGVACARCYNAGFIIQEIADAEKKFLV
jgi:hypothetical protein